MRKMPMSEYRWKLFKMTWLVPNWGRARGPAFWLYLLKEWWYWNMNMRYTTGFLYKVVDWWKSKFTKKLTPWLSNARDFMEIFINENGTKLLDYDAWSFRTRTRDEHQYYFDGEVSLFGKVRIWQTQYKDSSGEAQNAFVNAIVGDEDLKPVTKLLWQGRILSKEAKIAAVEEALKFRHVGWHDFFVHCLLYGLKKLGKKEVFTGKKDCGGIYKEELPKIIEELLGEKKELYQLTDEEMDKIDAYIVEATK